MIIFNWIGIGICVIGFGIAFAIGYLLGTYSEGILMVIAGPIVAGLDLLYRFKSKDRRWFYPSGGGSLFFLPVWLFGVLWLILGIAYIIKT